MSRRRQERLEAQLRQAEQRAVKAEQVARLASRHAELISMRDRMRKSVEEETNRYWQNQNEIERLQTENSEIVSYVREADNRFGAINEELRRVAEEFRDLSAADAEVSEPARPDQRSVRVGRAALQSPVSAPSPDQSTQAEYVSPFMGISIPGLEVFNKPGRVIVDGKVAKYKPNKSKRGGKK